MRNFKTWAVVMIAALLLAAAPLIYPSGIQALATLFMGTTPISGGTNGDCLKITAGKLDQQACSAGATIPVTTNALVGDGAGNAAAATGTGTNCLLVNGSSSTCGGGTSFTPPYVLHVSAGNSATTLGAVVYANFTANNIAVVACDSFGSSAEPTFSDTLGTTYTKISNGQFGSNPHMTMFVGAPNNNTVSGTCGWQAGAASTKLTMIELPIALFKNVVDGTGGFAQTSQPSGNLGALFTVTTAVANDLIITAANISQTATQVGTCPANAVQVAGNSGGSATTTTIICMGLLPVAVTNFPAAITFIGASQIAEQGFGLEHQ